MALLRNMRAREEVRGLGGWERRKITSSSKFERILKKLEQFGNYKRVEGN